MKNNYIITLRTPLNRVPIDYQGQPIIQENEHYREWLLCQDLTEQQAQEWLDEKAAELTLAAAEPDMIDKEDDYLSYDNKTWKIRTLKEALDMGMMGNMRRWLLREDWLRKKLAEALDCDPDSINKELTYRLHTDKNYLTLYVDEIGDIELVEYTDMNSMEYYEYPDRLMAVIYKWGLGTTPCNCDTCRLYRDYLAMSKEEYDALYGQGQADTWITTSLYDTLTEDGVDDYVSEIRKHIESIDWGYFVDER